MLRTLKQMDYITQKDGINAIDLSFLSIITPEIAQELISATTLAQEETPPRAVRNRNINQRKVLTIARDIKEVEWHPNGQPIILDQFGFILDGAHRLRGCVLAGLPITAFVIVGVDQSAFKSIDSGKVRSGPDVLQMGGKRNTHRLAATTRILIILERTDGLESAYSSGDISQVTNRECVEYADKYEPALDNSVRYYTGEARHLRSGAIVAVLHFMTNHKTPPDIVEKSRQFFSMLATGEGLEQRSPILLLRNFYSRASSRRENTPARIKAAMLIKAWNLFVTGQKRSSLQYKEREPFPTPIISLD